MHRIELGIYIVELKRIHSKLEFIESIFEFIESIFEFMETVLAVIEHNSEVAVLSLEGIEAQAE